MTEIIRASDIPPRWRSDAQLVYPYKEWVAMEKGQAAVIREGTFGEKKLSIVLGSIRKVIKAHREWGLTVVARKNVLYIIKK